MLTAKDGPPPRVRNIVSLCGYDREAGQGMSTRRAHLPASNRAIVKGRRRCPRNIL